MTARLRITPAHRTARLLHTAAMWHGDTGEGPVAMLSLSSTRTVHGEEHRARLLAEIADDIRWTLDNVGANEDSWGDVARLGLLARRVASCPVGEEWLSDAENLRLGEELYEAGLLEAVG